ncbi:hypothetical protein HRI_003127300 [Hibiscus trionum]|uniref:DUF4219 domain-containing protein n=1 Tax=Hibiscus trionum TaxID=183268 RepID=A0A9W7MDT6_HIBTR|nr:hypothetical protein HRI_003127300 [Hibiscus trionum]
MAQSIDKPPFFDGDHYALWKTKMKFFIKSRDYKLWDVVEDGPFVPQRSKAEWSADDRKKMELNCKALHILFCAFGPSIYDVELIKQLQMAKRGVNWQLKIFVKRILENKMTQGVIVVQVQQPNSTSTTLAPTKDFPKQFTT